MTLQSDKLDITRRENARRLAEEAGSKASFAEIIERSPGQVGHFIGPNPTKNIGKDLARHIERRFRKRKYWLDQDHTPPAEREEVEARLSDQSPEDLRQFVSELSEALPLADAAWAAALFADRVRRGLEEG